MTGADQVLAGQPATVARRARPPRRHARLHGAELGWSIVFVLPYAALFLAFAIYPMAYGLWMGRSPALYAELLADPRYAMVALNTVIFVGLAVNLQMVLALLLSGFFARRRRWIKILLVIYILPWTLPAVPAFLSFHWMLAADEWGLIDRLLWVLFGIQGPNWFNHGWLALASNIVADVWKWMPLWTLIFLGGRMAIPQDLYDAADVDGASAYRKFLHITLPLITNLYVISTLISAIWTFGDYTPVLFVSGGTPAFASDVLSTLGFHYALDFADPQLGVAAGLSVLPVLIPIVLLLMRRLQLKEVQL